MTFMLYERYQQPLLAETQNSIVIDFNSATLSFQPCQGSLPFHSFALATSISTSVYIDPAWVKTSALILCRNVIPSDKLLLLMVQIIIPI